jgi:hypothetical protein
LKVKGVYLSPETIPGDPAIDHSDRAGCPTAELLVMGHQEQDHTLFVQAFKQLYYLLDEQQ